VSQRLRRVLARSIGVREPVGAAARRLILSPAGLRLVALTVPNKTRRGWIEYGDLDHLKEGLSACGMRVANVPVDVEDYHHWMRLARYDDFPAYYGSDDPFSGAFTEKTLEHYLSAKLLEMSAEDSYVDIASDQSPVPQIFNRLYGCKTYRQDLQYPPGLHGHTIGGDAGNMPVADGFATKMALHCSFEHFEGDADTRFVREVNRVLRIGGKCCIVPLYLASEYAIQTDPLRLLSDRLNFERDATVFLARSFHNRHARFYDAERLRRRVVTNLGDLALTICFVENPDDIAAGCYVRFVALMEKR